VAGVIVEFDRTQHLHSHKSHPVLVDMHCVELCQDPFQMLAGEELNPEMSETFMSFMFSLTEPISLSGP